jgi:hypothetical protein
MKTSESIDKIAPAILAAQRETKNPKRTSVNPFYNSKYAPLNEVLEIRAIYNKHGMSILQDIDSNGCVSTMILHESGQWVQQDGMRLPLDKQTSQGAGSAVTYGRRYTLEAMTGTASEEDDDGNSGEKPHNGNKDEDVATRLSKLPDNVKDGARALALTRNQVVAICVRAKWDNDKILAEINRMADQGAA